MNKRKRIALVVGADLTDGRTVRGGVVNVMRFIHRVVLDSRNYDVKVISTAVSMNDQYSVRLFSPSSWRSAPKMVELRWGELPILHAGAFLTEIEGFRYLPRRFLTSVLNTFDLIQVVAGTPAIGYIAKNARVPMCLQVATTAKRERGETLGNRSLIRRAKESVMLPWISVLERAALRNSAHIFADTEYTKSALAGIVEESRVTIDTIGVDTATFRPSGARKGDFLLTVGRLDDPRKNIATLLQAYSFIVRQLRKPPRLVLAGMTGLSGADQTLLKKLEIEEMVDVVLSPTQTQLVKLYQDATLFVLSSFEEGLGIVLLEALACGTPVVSSRCGGPESFVTPEVGVLTNVGDAGDLATKMLHLLRNEQLRQHMGESGRRLVLRRFSFDVVARKYLDVYSKILLE